MMIRYIRSDFLLYASGKGEGNANKLLAVHIGSYRMREKLLLAPESLAALSP